MVTGVTGQVGMTIQVMMISLMKPYEAGSDRPADSPVRSPARGSPSRRTTASPVPEHLEL